MKKKKKVCMECLPDTARLYNNRDINVSLHRLAGMDMCNIWSTFSSMAQTCVRRTHQEIRRCTSVPFTTK